MEALSDWFKVRRKEFWAKMPHGQMRGTIADIWAEEALALMPVSRPFDGFVECTKRVPPTCLVCPSSRNVFGASLGHSKCPFGRMSG
jgi:hypothetical protein